MDDRRLPVLVVSIFFFVFASAFVGLYLISCLLVVKRLRLADYLMLLAWVIDLGFVISLLYAVGRGLGLHDRHITPENQIRINKSMYTFTILYNLVSMAAKSSILIFYLALTYEKRHLYWLNCALLLVVNSVGLALTIKDVFQCTPVSNFKYFDSQPSKDCSNVFTTSLSSSPYNIFTDIAILLTPAPLLTRISLPFKQRVILVITFCAGFLVIGVDIARVAVLQNVAKYRLIELHSFYAQDITNKDYAWYAARSFMWSVVEVNMTIICACVPSLKPLAARISPSLIFSRHEANQLKSREMGTPRSANNGYRTHGEMIDVLTRSGQQERQQGENAKREKVRDRYPQNIRLLNLLNLRPTRVLRLDARQSIPPNLLVIILFFTWGFAYGILETLGSKLGPIHYSQAISYGIISANWAGYIGAVLFGRYILIRRGFAVSFIWGLYIYALGSLLFWPAAILLSAPISFVSVILTGIGIGIIQMGASLFIALCGPLECAEIRLCIAHAFRGIGNLLSLLLTDKGLFPHPDSVAELINVQWICLAVAILNVLLAVIYYYVPVPETSDEDLKELAQQRPANNARAFGMPVVYVTLVLGVCSQFFNVAGLQAHQDEWFQFQEIVLPRSTLGYIDYTTIGYTAWITSLFIAAFLQWMGFKPRQLLLMMYIFSIITTIICVKTVGITSIIFALLIWFTEAPLYPVIFGISIRGTGIHAKTAASLLSAAAIGGSIGVSVRYVVRLSIGDPGSYYVVVGFFSAGAIFPLYLNFVPAAKRQVDPVKDEYLRDSSYSPEEK